MRSTERLDTPSPDGTTGAEAVRVQRLRADAQRPMSVSLAETIAPSHKLLQFAGVARKG